MNLGLSGKRVLITGASRGIGAAIAKAFLEEGAKVCIVSRGSEKLYKTEQGLILKYSREMVKAVKCDCSEPSSLEELKRCIRDQWDLLDVVIANIGDGRSVPDPIPSGDQWQKTWKNNFDPAIHTARTFIPMLKKSKGCLLFVSSITALEAFGAPVDYSTAKSAVVALAKNMSRKLATQVRINVLAPGNIYYPGGRWDEKIKQNRTQVQEIIELNVPMKRFGTPEEMADAAVFLCSERAKFITGSVLVADGGQTVGVF
jgi:3-oxoacyl-[acyl-carrier protein] reductase